MDYSSLGYYLACLSPILALILCFGICLPSVGTSAFAGVPFQVFLIEVAIPTVIVVMIGFALYLFGYRKNESMPYNSGLNILLVLWGILVMLFGGAMYGVLLDWARLAQVTVTMYSYPEIVTYTTVAIMGLLWVNLSIALTIVYRRSSKVANRRAGAL